MHRVSELPVDTVRVGYEFENKLLPLLATIFDFLTLRKDAHDALVILKSENTSNL